VYIFTASKLRKIDVLQSRDQCCGHDFLRFSIIFGEKFGAFLKTRVIINVLSQINVILTNILGDNIFTMTTSVPGKALQKLGLRGTHSAQKVFSYDAMRIKILPALSDNYMYLV
jgi:hypothetical protein